MDFRGQGKNLGNVIRVLSQSAVAVPLTGSVAETVLASFTIPAGLLGKDGAVRVTAVYSCTNSANTKTLRIRFGGAGVISTAATNVASASFQPVIRNRGAANSQIAYVASAAYGSSASAVAALAVDTTQDVAVTITGQLTSAGENITLEAFTIELLPGAN